MLQVERREGPGQLDTSELQGAHQMDECSEPLTSE